MNLNKVVQVARYELTLENEIIRQSKQFISCLIYGKVFVVVLRKSNFYRRLLRRCKNPNREADLILYLNKKKENHTFFFVAAEMRTKLIKTELISYLIKDSNLCVCVHFYCYKNFF